MRSTGDGVAVAGMVRVLVLVEVGLEMARAHPDVMMLEGYLLSTAGTGMVEEAARLATDSPVVVAGATLMIQVPDVLR